MLSIEFHGPEQLGPSKVHRVLSHQVAWATGNPSPVASRDSCRSQLGLQTMKLNPEAWTVLARQAEAGTGIPGPESEHKLQWHAAA
jgi:hypothetical protein